MIDMNVSFPTSTSDRYKTRKKKWQRLHYYNSKISLLHIRNSYIGTKPNESSDIIRNGEEIYDMQLKNVSVVIGNLGPLVPPNNNPKRLEEITLLNSQVILPNNNIINPLLALVHKLAQLTSFDKAVATLVHDLQGPKYSGYIITE
jgi:hypothetical protein